MYIIPPEVDCIYGPPYMTRYKIPNSFPFAYRNGAIHHYSCFLKQFSLHEMIFININTTEYVNNFDIYQSKKFRLIVSNEEYRKGINHYKIEQFYPMFKNGCSFYDINTNYKITANYYIIEKRYNSILFLKDVPYPESRIQRWAKMV